VGRPALRRAALVIRPYIGSRRSWWRSNRVMRPPTPHGSSSR